MISFSCFQHLSQLPEWEKHIFFIPSEQEDKISLLALGKNDDFLLFPNDKNSLDHFQSWLDQDPTWSFGIISYDVKNKIEALQSPYSDEPLYPLIAFFRPKVVIQFTDDTPKIIYNTSSLADETLYDYLFDSTKQIPYTNNASIFLTPQITRAQYLTDVTALLNHIQQGNIYEVNYCQTFFSTQKIDCPSAVFFRLYELTNAPHACYVQMDSRHLLCASPERFLKRAGNKIISQPIKGTIRRGTTPMEDEQLKHELYHNKKERSENVMIVDLVRNDLSRHALPGSVQVDRLFEIKCFQTVHHLVSTLSAVIPHDISFTQLLRDTFPMGSMTGAPKIRSMQLITSHESSARGWYSGCAGYIDPKGNFDFNVVIRSIIYNDTIPHISCSVGSAITIQANPEKEYDECLLKADALFRTLRMK